MGSVILPNALAPPKLLLLNVAMCNSAKCPSFVILPNAVMGSVILPNALAPPKLLLLNLEVPSKEVNFYQLHFRNGSSFKHFVSSQVFIQIGNCNIEILGFNFNFIFKKTKIKILNSSLKSAKRTKTKLFIVKN